MADRNRTRPSRTPAIAGRARWDCSSCLAIVAGGRSRPSRDTPRAGSKRHSGPTLPCNGVRDRTEPVMPSTPCIAARAADAKKGDDIVVLDVGDIIGIVDTFVITSAPNTRLVRTIVDEVEKQLLEQTGVKPRSVEGLDDYSWVLLDYGDLVVHVFLDRHREFYGLERLWTDAATHRLERRRAG